MLKLNNFGFLDERIIGLIFAFVIGLIIGEIFQMIFSDVLFPQVVDTFSNAGNVEGEWGEIQDKSISAIRIGIDLLFGAVGTIITFVGFIAIFDR